MGAVLLYRPASLCSLGDHYDYPTRFQSPIDCFKILAQNWSGFVDYVVQKLISNK
jgi:hypothetical protein